MFGGNFAPRGWAFCSGQELPISESEALFSLIGTMYGGDGQTTFALPNLQGRIPVHQGVSAAGSNRGLGETGGTEAVTLIPAQLAAHAHSLLASTDAANTPNPSNALLARPADPLYAAPNALVSLSAQAVTSSGGSQPHNNIQPFLCVNFIIALEGIYPPRS